MVATLRVVLDGPSEPDLLIAARQLARALVATTPRGCEVEGIVPAGDGDLARDDVPGLSDIFTSRLPRRELATALQLGAPSGIGGGLIHAPTLFAPLVRHDRVHSGDQTVVTLWDLRAWEAPDELGRGAVSWQKSMLKRAVKHADAVVVPTHAHAERLSEIAPKLGDRIRVIAGAAPHGFAVPRDEIGRRRDLGLPEGFVLVSGGVASSDGLADAFAAVAASGVELPVVIIDAGEGEEPAIADLASAAGIREGSVHVRGALEDADRAAVLGASVAYLTASSRTTFPWRIVEALALGVPIIAEDTAVHREVIVDGGLLVSGADAAGAALAEALGSSVAAERLGVLAADRGRAFAWRDAANRVWELHAEL